MSNYVSQVVRKEVGQEQERQHLNMKQTWDRTEEINKNGHIIQKKKGRIHHNIMTNVSVTSALVKPDEPAPHGRSNSGKVSYHERIMNNAKHAIR